MSVTTPASLLPEEAPTGLLSLTQAIFFTGLSGECLRRYERDGLFTCQRTAQGHRLFSAKDLETARQVYAARVARHGYTGRRNLIAS
jgi:hypothetical protein